MGMPSPKLVPLLLTDAERMALGALPCKRTASQALPCLLPGWPGASWLSVSWPGGWWSVAVDDLTVGAVSGGGGVGVQDEPPAATVDADVVVILT